MLLVIDVDLSCIRKISVACGVYVLWQKASCVDLSLLLCAVHPSSLPPSIHPKIPGFVSVRVCV